MLTAHLKAEDEGNPEQAGDRAQELPPTSTSNDPVGGALSPPPPAALPPGLGNFLEA